MITRFDSFPSQHVPSRPVEVWLPPGYDRGDRSGYPVLYMHDGQNVFSADTSYSGVPWAVDEALSQLIGAGTVKPAIVVAVWNDGNDRVSEYMPQHPFKSPAGEERLARLRAQWPDDTVQAELRGDAYLRFLVDELKPFVDGEYNSRPERAHTTLMGSSMGGLISLYALCEYPGVFGAAACLSTHWPAPGELMLDYLRASLPPPGKHRLYFDHGTIELDALYGPYQAQVDAVLREAGYQQDVDWQTRVFPGAGHSERAWQERVEIPLTFLLGRA